MLNLRFYLGLGAVWLPAWMPTRGTFWKVNWDLEPGISNFLVLFFLLIIVDSTAVNTARQQKENFESTRCIPRKETDAWYKGLSIIHFYGKFGAGSYHFMPLLELLNISGSSSFHWKANVRVLTGNRYQKWAFWIQIIANFLGLYFLQKATWSYLARLFFSEGKSACRCFQMFFNFSMRQMFSHQKTMFSQLGKQLW